MLGASVNWLISAYLSAASSRNLSRLNIAFSSKLRKIVLNDNLDYTSIYTQVYTSDGSWSIRLDFDPPPRIQGYRSIGKAAAMVPENAPADLLHAGKIFPFMDGPREVGTCKIVEDQSNNLSSLIEDIEAAFSIEQKITNTIIDLDQTTDQNMSDDSILSKLIIHSDRFPSLFEFVAKRNSSIASNYLTRSYLNEGF